MARRTRLLLTAVLATLAAAASAQDGAPPQVTGPAVAPPAPAPPELDRRALPATPGGPQSESPPGATSPATAAKTEPTAAPQKWEFGIGIRAVNGPCPAMQGTFPVPSDWPEQQVKVVSEAITPTIGRHAFRQLDGLKQMVFELPPLRAGDAATCFVTVEVAKQPQSPPADSSGLVLPKERDVPRDVKKYLLPSPLIEIASPKVRALAKELTEGQDTAWEQVQSIVAGVRERVRFEQDGRNLMRGAGGALKDGKADKEDLTAAFVAICRAAKIPARMVWAMDFCYAEFYLNDADGKGAWYPCVVHQEVELGACRDLRPILHKGDNFKVPEEKAPQRFVKEHLAGKGSGVKPSVEFRRHRLD